MPIKPRIKARDAVRDIRSGMTDSQLMEKHGISAKGLQSLFAKLIDVKAMSQVEMSQRKALYHDTTVIAHLNEKDIVADIRSGTSDSKLMEKYALSGDGLRRVLQTLIDASALTPEDLYGTSPAVHDSVFLENMRELPRQYLAIAVDIYESKRPELAGTLSDLTEKGLAISGIESKIGETKSFVLPAQDFIAADPILFEAKCRWATRQQDTGDWIAGFEITRVSRKCLEDLRSLIESLPFLR